ncbi:MAG TPA: xylanase [Verrucomicrobiales bacterium]|nr:xylanase [Verrucomicrobiales bacterium]
MHRIARSALLAAMLSPGILISRSAIAAGSAPAPVVALWPGTPPGDSASPGEEKDLTTPKDGLVAGRRLIRLGNVSSPSLTLYRPPKSKATGTAVLVCPGGGYHILAMDLEGTEVAERLNAMGVTAVVLKYRVPVRKDRPRFEAPLQDAQRAMGLIRLHAGEWGIDPGRVGILGFSAGGHLSAVTSCHDDTRTYPPVDAADKERSRPNFAVVVYPGYLVEGKEGTTLPPELTVTAATPPTFLVQAEDDEVPVESSLFYFHALKKAKVEAELHVYARGGHGYGLRPTSEPVTHWPDLLEAWMRHRKLLERAR